MVSCYTTCTNPHPCFLILGIHNSFTGRFLGVSLIVSNSTNPNSGVVCYVDKNNTRSTIPSVLDVNCPVIGRYVILRNERVPGITYPNEYSTFAYASICEMEVFGRH